MTLEQYASKIYLKMEAAESIEDVEKYFNDAIENLINQNLSEIQIGQFKEYLRSHLLKLNESQANDQTLKNQQKARELLKKKDK